MTDFGQLTAAQSTQLLSSTPAPPSERSGETKDLRQAFDRFVGETFFSQMLQAMRKTVGEPAYFHGGRAEEIFQGQLDQILSQQLTKASAGQFSGPMFDLFMLERK